MQVVLDRIQRALHPLDSAPRGDGWNLDELADLLPPQRDPVSAAVLVALIPRDDALHVLLTRRTDALRQHAGQVSFPGGRIDPGDADAVAAALREAHEEVGLDAAHARPLGYLDPLVTITGYRVVPVVARVDAAFEPVPEPGEVSAVFDVPLEWLMAPANLRRVQVEFRGRPREVLEFAPAPAAPTQRIWGVTASILFNLRQRLEHRP